MELSAPHIDHKILVRLVIITVVIIAAYMIFDLIIGIKKEDYLIQFSVIATWVITLFFTLKGKHLQFIKHFTIVVMMSTTYAGYFVLDGFNGVTIIDFFNLIFLISILTDGYSRILYLSVHFLTIIFLIYLNWISPEMITNNYKDFKNTHLIFGSGVRMLNTLFIAVLMRNQYNKEYAQINTINRKLKEQYDKLFFLNEEIRRQAADLENKNNYIHTLNQGLEQEVLKRTRRLIEQNKKLTEYAYFNSHKVRGPVARILGLAYLTQAEKNISFSELLSYVDLMSQSAKELDDVVKSINRLLEEDSGMDHN